jgi:hypothetical protein
VLQTNFQVRRQAWWCLSNLTAGTHLHLSRVLAFQKGGLIGQLLNTTLSPNSNSNFSSSSYSNRSGGGGGGCRNGSNGETKQSVRYEALWVLCNVCNNGSHDAHYKLLKDFGAVLVVARLCEALGMPPQDCGSSMLPTSSSSSSSSSSIHYSSCTSASSSSSSASFTPHPSLDGADIDGLDDDDDEDDDGDDENGGMECGGSGMGGSGGGRSGQKSVGVIEVSGIESLSLASLTTELLLEALKAVEALLKCDRTASGLLKVS